MEKEREDERNYVKRRGSVGDCDWGGQWFDGKGVEDFGNVYI